MKRLAYCLLVLAVSLPIPQQGVGQSWVTRSSPALCDLGSQAVSFTTLDRMPRAIVEDVLSRLPRAPSDGGKSIASRDQDFNATDLVKDGWPMRRFVQGGQMGNLLFIWYEHGGRGFHHDRIGYELMGESANPRLIGSVQGGSCAELVEFLHQRNAQPLPAPSHW